MAAGVEVIDLIGKILHSRNVLAKAAVGKVAHLRVRGGGVERIRRVGNERAKRVVPAERKQRLRVRGINFLGAAAARIPRKKLECVRAN